MVVSCERRLFSNFRWPKIIRPIGGEGCTQSGQILSAPVLLSAQHPIDLALNGENSNKCSEQVYQSVSADKRKDISKDP